MQAIVGYLEGKIPVPVHSGVPPTGARLPYVLVRPVSTDPSNVTLRGIPATWHETTGVYCAANGALASDSLARDVARILVGVNVGSGVLIPNIMYHGTHTDGMYESLVMLEHDTGGL